MKKVILKYKLSSREKFEDSLSNIDLDFSAMYWQHDRVYVPRGYKPGLNLPRLVMRTEMKAVDKPPKYAMILRRHIEDSGIDIVEEIPVKDYQSAANIIMQLGFIPAGEVSRRRQDLKINKTTYIYLDKIDGKPGNYAKIESVIGAKDAVSSVKDGLKKTFESLGETNLVDRPYVEI